MKKYLAILSLVTIASPAFAALLTVDQIIFQNVNGINSGQLSGTIDYSVTGANQATVTFCNTSPDSAFTDSSFPAAMLMTGFGLQLPGVNILNGTVSVSVGSTALNFDVGQSTTNISNQYMFANQSIDGYNNAGVLLVDSVVTSVNNGQGTRFAGPPPVTIDGPGYGAISNLETQFGHSTPGVDNCVTVVLDFNAAAPSFGAVNAGNVVLAFGSPDTVGRNVPDTGATVMLLGIALAACEFGRRVLGNRSGVTKFAKASM